MATARDHPVPVYYCTAPFSFCALHRLLPRLALPPVHSSLRFPTTNPNPIAATTIIHQLAVTAPPRAEDGVRAVHSPTRPFLASLRSHCSRPVTAITARQFNATARRNQIERAASPPWAILGSVPWVAAADADLPPGADVSLALPAPPRVGHLTIPPRIFGDRTAPDNFPSVLAADPSGLLLLHANQRHATCPPVINTPSLREFMWRPFVPGYFVLDATTGSARPLPEPELIMHPGHLGLISSPASGGHYMVAELQPFIGGDQAVLLRFSSEVGEWVSKYIGYPLPARILCPNGAVSHAGRLWWVDLSWCLLTCDPFAESPVLKVVPLPEGKALQPREAWGVLDKYRCVGVSAGKLRFVDMYRNRNSRGAAQISVWTLADPDTMKWKLECKATFKDIWDDASYKATGLPRKMPVLALIHPTNPDVVYFFLDDHMLGVDVRARKVVHCEAYELVAPPSEHVATRFIHAWELPRALCSGSAMETEDSVKEDLHQLHQRDKI